MKKLHGGKWIVFLVLLIILVVYFGIIYLTDTKDKYADDVADQSVIIEDNSIDANDDTDLIEPEPEHEPEIEAKEDTRSDEDDTETEESFYSIEDLEPGEVVDASDLSNDTTQYFATYNILEGDAVFERIIGKSFVYNDNIGLDDLRYLKIIHYNFDHHIQVGEMIVNKEISDDVISIFRELFEAEYEIQSVYLIDNYWMGDGGSTDDESIKNNNTSAFCYRYVTNGSKLSNHAYGRAIDINPKQNPYIRIGSDGTYHWTAEDAEKYIDRTGVDTHMIRSGDLCYESFTKHGFKWGGNWSNPIDYQHFEK